jgi:hypothetical protein
MDKTEKKVKALKTYIADYNNKKRLNALNTLVTEIRIKEILK